MPPNDRLVDVAVPLPLFNTFTYSIPPEYSANIRVGMRVLVPFGRRRLTGYIVGFSGDGRQHDIKEILDVLDEEPLFEEIDLKFYKWASSYYFHPIGQTIKAALPKGLNTEYGYAASITKKGRDFLAKDPVGSPVLLEISDGKEVALKRLEKKVARKGFYYHISRLKENGFIQLSLKKKGGGVAVRKEKWFSAEDYSFEKALKGKQKEILGFIVENGKVPLAALKQKFGNCLNTLKRLTEKGAIAVEEREVLRSPPRQKGVFAEPVHDPTLQQAKVLKQIESAVIEKKFYPFLLYGVTGSGKTEIYLKLMEKVVNSGGQCLYLVPEISLTVQLWDRVSSRLMVPITMLHSGLTNAERYDAWRIIKRGSVNVVIGARSAVFASFSDLGLIIVDEEHDNSYKQDEKLRYNARDLALLKGKLSGSVVVLGSATPSLESYYNTVKKKYFIGTLANRIDNRPLPHVKVVDMKLEAGPQNKKTGIISLALQKALEKRLLAGQQSLLFLNRRGFSPAFLCRQCGYTFKCRNCNVSLIHHRGQKKLRCHYCDLSMHVPEECPECGSYFLISLGWGTERLEKDIEMLFPGARIARMDRDTTAAKGSSGLILAEVYKGKVDILIGTQMIVKGHHFPNVTLVGVLCADQSLNFPDYRASERTFQLLTQVAGRAGRGDVDGEVLIQAYNPEHYSIACAQGHDFRKFYKIEMQYRKELGYPPFNKLINIRFEGINLQRVEACARRFGNLGRRFQESADFKETVEILGPARAPWEKIKNRYRYQMLLKGGNLQRLRDLTSRVISQGEAYAKSSGVKLIVDVDPLFIM